MVKVQAREKAVFNWSGGKDSALCLHKVLAEGHYTMESLLTTVNAHYQRISMHGVRVELLEQQALSIGIPLRKVSMPEMPDMQQYESAMQQTLQGLKKENVTASIFGDIFLEDLRQYREEQLSSIGMKGIFPLWKVPTGQLIQQFIWNGFKAVIVCVNEKYLDRSFAGRELDNNFITDLPKGVDPCGENGEYHSFVYDGPLFNTPIEFTKGEVVYRRYQPTEGSQSSDCFTNNNDPFGHGFWYCDLIPADQGT
ncbi:MAG: diphthine--ammonia ligase [Ignavibacteriales bacterium]|nr:diphthine--ammonia ligase [Ignavibacteriales bacterium]